MDAQQYNSEIESIFNRFPSFQKVGGVAYKPGLATMTDLCEALGNPQKRFKAIHIAGTNGKGSTSHMIASALACLKKSGGESLKVGLYTSPHLLDFRERMKVSEEIADNGACSFVMPSREYVYSFLVNNRSLFEATNASFFEITTVLAFCWFAEQNIDIAVVECGLGGRLDATNILEPLLGIITNIGLDHCEYLGNTLECVAAEKAGIMKRGVTTIIGEKSGVENLFLEKAAEKGAQLVYAEEYTVKIFTGLGTDCLDLKGKCQEKNINTVVTALETLLENGCFDGLTDYREQLDALKWGIANAAHITGLHGRWETLSKKPFIVCDTGHNAHGFAILGQQIRESVLQNSEFTGKPFSKLVMIFGVVADKDLEAVAQYLPLELPAVPIEYYFVNAAGTRALPAEMLKNKMERLGFNGKILGNGNIADTLELYMSTLADETDFVFIGGSTFVVAEALSFFQK